MLAMAVFGAVDRRPTFTTEEHLTEAEVSVADVLHVVLLQRPLDDLRRVVLAGQLGTGHSESHSLQEHRGLS